MDSSLGSKIASKLYSLDALQKGKLYLKSKTVLPIYLFGPGCCKQRSSLFQQYLAAVKQRKNYTTYISLHENFVACWLANEGRTVCDGLGTGTVLKTGEVKSSACLCCNVFQRFPSF